MKYLTGVTLTVILVISATAYAGASDDKSTDSAIQTGKSVSESAERLIGDTLLSVLKRKTSDPGYIEDDEVLNVL